MKEGFRQSMAWLHTWLGLVVGWVLYFVYLTGTLGYLDKEIDYWMAPEKPFFAVSTPPERQLELAQARLSTAAAGAQTWNIQLAGGREAPWLEIRWTMPPDASGKRGLTKRETLHPVTGAPFDNNARATSGGQVLYRMHYSLAYMPLNTAILIVMICTVIMFAGMITGIIAHKRIFADLFTFRPGKGQRSWLDGHNLLSVTSLPFHLVVTYSGLLFFVFIFVPSVPKIVFSPEPGRTVQQQVYGDPPGPKGAADAAAAGVAAPLGAMSLLLGVIEENWGKDQLTSLEVRHPGDANARVIAKPLPGKTVAIPDYSLVFDGVSGKLLADAQEPYPFGKADQLLKGVHRGLFAGPFLRFLYLFMGIGGTAMIGTGLLLWSNKRTAKLRDEGRTRHFGITLVDTLNLGTIVGLPIAIAAYFWANRLLPASMDSRAAWEVHVMFATLAAMFVYPVVRPLRRAWIELLWLAAASIGLLPLLNALTTNRHLGESLPQSDWVMAGFDITAMAIGLIFAAFALRQTRRAAGVM
jgi:uncharacterized iron-regulated membrane protein